MKRILPAAACILAAALAGCATTPVDYAASLSTQDPKWQSSQCQQARSDAQAYDAREKEHPSWGTGIFLGPYGLGIVSAIKEHEQKQRRAFAREVHMNCSSLPLPKELQPDTSSQGGPAKYP
jgi:hypothetical protein